MRISASRGIRSCSSGWSRTLSARAAWFAGIWLASATCGQPAPAALGQDRTTAPERASVPLARIEATPAPPSLPVHALDETPRIRDLYEQAREQLQDGDARSALANLDAALNDADGDYYELHYLLAQTKFRLGRLGEARAAAEFAARLRHGSADVHYLLGTLYRQQQRFEQATPHFRTATLAAQREVNNPRVTAAWYELGRCLSTQGYLRAAAEAFQRFDEALWDTHPEHRAADEIRPVLATHPRGMIERRLELLRQSNRMDDAVSSAAWAAESRPEDVFLARLYGRVLLEAGRAQHAFEYAHSRLKQDGARGLLPIAAQAARVADRAAAWVAELEKDIATEPGCEFATAAAQQLSAAGAYAEAARLLQALLNQRPEDADTAWALAATQRATGDLAEAFQTLSTFVRDHPTSDDVSHRRLTQWLAAPDAVDQTPAFVAERSAAVGRDFATNFVLGTLAASAGQPDVAEKLLRASLDARPDVALARRAWGHMLLSLYRWEPAQEQAAAALEANPDSATAHFIMAQAHAGLDENDAAEESYKAAVNLAQNDPACAAAFGRFQRRLGNMLGAQRYFQQALSIDPAHAQAVEGLIESYVGGDKAELARVQLEQAERLDLPDDVLRRCRNVVRFSSALFQEEHLAELERQFAQHPEDTLTGLQLAGALFAPHGRVEEAYEIALRVRAHAPDDDRLLSLLARLQKQRLEYEAAIETLQILAERYPKRRAVLTLLAATHLHDFQLAEARAVLRRILGFELNDELRGAYRTQLLWSYIEFSEFADALNLLGEWRSQQPENDALLQDELTVLSQAGRHSEAVEAALAYFDEIWDRWLTVLLDPGSDGSSRLEADARIRSAFGVCFVVCEAGDELKQLEQRLRVWLEKQPGTAALVNWLIQVLLADERPAEALEVVAAFRPTTLGEAIAARIWRGNCLAAVGRLDDALAEFDALLNDRNVRSAPSAVMEVRERLVSAFVRAARYDDALQRLAAWEAELGHGADAARQYLLFLKRTILLSAGRTAEYTRVTETLFEHAPDDVGLNNDLGYTWVDAGRNVERATSMIRKAVAADPLNPAYLDSLGWAYYKAGDFAAAREYLARSVQLRTGQSAVVYDHLGDTLYRLADHEAARQQWQKALELLDEEPDEPLAAEEIELPAKIRAKLSALKQSDTPLVAPTAAEQR